MGQDQALSAALQLQHDAGLILSNLQVLSQFVTSLNRMSSEVMQLAFAHGSRPVCGAISSSPTGSPLHVCHGVVASAEYPGSSWAPAVVLMQCLHDVFGLFPRWGGGGWKKGDVNIMFCVHILPPAQTTDDKTFKMTYV